MPELFFHNSLTRRKERFQPIQPSHVRMYVCGPTVYDLAHVGNARPAVVFDAAGARDRPIDRVRRVEPDRKRAYEFDELADGRLHRERRPTLGEGFPDERHLDR